MTGLIRPEVHKILGRWGELLIAICVALFGAWVFGLGGYFYQGLGMAVLLTGVGAAYVALRRLRFRTAGGAPGVVAVDEGQITYLAPVGGGFVALSELEEVAMVFGADGTRHWRLSQAQFPTVMIPAAAEGSDALFDVFVSLPGARPGQILAAAERPFAEGPVTVWRRQARAALT